MNTSVIKKAVPQQNCLISIIVFPAKEVIKIHCKNIVTWGQEWVWGRETSNLVVGETTQLSGRNDPCIRGRSDSGAKLPRLRSNRKLGETTRYPSYTSLYIYIYIYIYIMPMQCNALHFIFITFYLFIFFFPQ